MSDKPGFVFDTNVMVSALLLPASAPARAVSAALEKGVVLLSLPVLRELEGVLFRSKSDKYVTVEERQKFLSSLTDACRPIVASESFHVCRDPKVDQFLDLAVAGHAQSVVSGDVDLLSMSPFRGIPIVTPAAFLTVISA